jgi:release factor glutamine methyltransferase
MNVNLQPQTPTINDWLSTASIRLTSVGINSARLDSELILANSLNKSRTFLHAHNDEMIDIKHTRIANSQLARRIHHEPVAYITGYKDFFGRKFIVNTDTLIPRPESEDIISVLKQLLPPTSNRLLPTKLVDVGTGSGCLGITAKLEFSFLEITLVDISKKALLVAKQNAKKHNANVKIIESDLLQNYSEETDIIIANLPYVDAAWKRLPETSYEPRLALIADGHGLLFNQRLIVQASDALLVGGYLIIEADPEQHSRLIEYANKHSFQTEIKNNYVISFKKL